LTFGQKNKREIFASRFATRVKGSAGRCDYRYQKGTADLPPLDDVRVLAIDDKLDALELVAEILTNTARRSAYLSQRETDWSHWKRSSLISSSAMTECL
jgi:hypothetical protein